MDMSEATRLLDAELERLAVTQARIERNGAGTMPSTEDGPDTADSARELVEREEHESLLKPVLAEIADVRHAYGRLLHGSYGECEACGDPIPDERLQALPAARYCVFDEQRREGRAPA